VFVDDRGVTLPGSTVTAMVAEWFLGRHPGSSIVHNLICSRAVPETVRAAGGTPVRTRVGHSYIKAVMAESGAVFGGEHSGHYYYRDNFRADSGVLTMLVLLRLLGGDERLSSMRRRFEPYAQSGEINMRVTDQEAASAAVAAAFPGDHDALDGLTVDLGDRWFNLRPSNTEPVLRLNVEAPTADAVDDLVTAVRATIDGVV
jgi:phosphomannomutase